VPWSTRIGAIGELEIRTRLQYFSLPTKYDLDVGIDFYCELLENDTPTTPFYVQAKGTEHFDDTWGVSIEKSTIVYWLNRGFPVFLIVFDEREGTCYWMSIEDGRYDLLQKLESPSATIYVRMNKANLLEKNLNLPFVERIRDNLISIEQWRGQAHFKGNGYVKTVPGAPRSDIELSRIRENVRMNMYSLIQHYLQTNDIQGAYNCCEFLVKFDESHYNHFMWFALINKELGKKPIAREYFRRALDICERDKAWPRESMNKLKDTIRKAMESD